MTIQRLSIRLLPMMIIPWIRTSVGVLIPGMIATFDLTISQAGLIALFIESGSVTGMLVLGFVIDHIGAVRVVGWGIPIMGVALLVATMAPTFVILAPILFMVGIGIALTGSGVNTLMAATGERRGFYLGILHAMFSVFAIITPLIAGVIIAYDVWQSYYILVAGYALVVLILFRIFERPKQAQTEIPRVMDIRALLSDTGVAMKRIATVCTGVFALAGVQGIFITWSYLYMVNVHGVGHGMATLAPSLLWVGILLARSGTIGLSRRYSARTILLWSIVLSIGVLTVEWFTSTSWVTLLMLMILGIGVAGAFQLGTAWAADRIPDRVGTASTYVLASAALGIGVWPWITGVVIDATDFSSTVFVAFAGIMIAGIMFAVTGDHGVETSE